MFVTAGGADHADQVDAVERVSVHGYYDELVGTGGIMHEVAGHLAAGEEIDVDIEAFAIKDFVGEEAVVGVVFDH